MPDWDERKIKATGRIQKLLALATDNPNSHEAEQAMARATKMAEEYGINIAEIRPDIKTPLTKEAQKKQGFAAMDRMFGSIKKAYPGIDDEDYSKYNKDK